MLENITPASMKDVEYNGTTAFTKNNLVACQCNYHSGGHNKEKVVYVQALPIIYQLIMLLGDKFAAEHFLIELCSRWNSITRSNKYHKAKQNIEILMRHICESDKK